MQDLNMGCTYSTASSTASAGLSLSPTLYAYFSKRIAATKYDGTDSPHDIDKDLLGRCAMEELIAPVNEPSLLELALFSPWFE